MTRFHCITEALMQSKQLLYLNLEYDYWGEPEQTQHYQWRLAHFLLYIRHPKCRPIDNVRVRDPYLPEATWRNSLRVFRQFYGESAIKTRKKRRKLQKMRERQSSPFIVNSCTERRAVEKAQINSTGRAAKSEEQTEARVLRCLLCQESTKSVC